MASHRSPRALEICTALVSFGVAAIILLVSSCGLLKRRVEGRTFGGADDEYGEMVQQTADGGYIVVGTTNSFGAGSSDIYLIKTDAALDTLWTRTFGGAGSDSGRAVELASDGGYIVAGTTGSFGHKDAEVYLVKTDAAGAVQWTRTYPYHWGSAVHATFDGGYTFVGTPRDTSLKNACLVRIDATGDTLWTATYGCIRNGRGALAIELTEDSGYAIVGAKYADDRSEGIGLLKTDAAGDSVWVRSYGGFYAGVDGVRQTPDGGYIIAGDSTDPSWAHDIYLIKTDSSGTPTWARTYDGSWFRVGAVQPTMDNGYVVVSWFGPPFKEAIYLVKTNSSGDTLWTRCYEGFDYAYGHGVRQTSDGGYVLVGTTSSLDRKLDVYLVKTDGSGSPMLYE